MISESGKLFLLWDVPAPLLTFGYWMTLALLDTLAESVLVMVGVPLLLDSTDIAEPGRGEGLGLRGISESVSSALEEMLGSNE